jgi:hypothetical protein
MGPLVSETREEGARLQRLWAGPRDARGNSGLGSVLPICERKREQACSDGPPGYQQQVRFLFFSFLYFPKHISIKVFESVL